MAMPNGQPNAWAVQHTPAAATQATITKAAVAGVRHVCDALTVKLACAGTAQTPLQAVLRDGASGAGTILMSWKLSAPINGSDKIELTGLNLAGSVNTAMTLETTGAGATATEVAVSMAGYDLPSS